jgi:hypothetical protein
MRLLKTDPHAPDFNHLGFNSPPLAASCHSGESRNPEIYTGCRVRSGMTSDTPLLCGGVVHWIIKTQALRRSLPALRQARYGALFPSKSTGSETASRSLAGHCERPKGARQSPQFQSLMRSRSLFRANYF